MTYAESCDKTPFNWEEFLNKENKTGDDWYEAKNKACSWDMCACANLPVEIPRNKTTGEPKDEVLAHLGNGFCEAICTENLERAMNTFQGINERAAEILQELG